MQDVVINIWAVLVAGVAYMVLGFLWYSPLLFGKQWMKMMGITQKHQEENKQNMTKTMGLSFLGSLVMAYVLAHVLSYTGAITVAQGMQGGFWVWLGFVATTGLNDFLFTVKPKPWSLYLINQGYLLVSLLVMGAVLAVWV